MVDRRSLRARWNLASVRRCGALGFAVLILLATGCDKSDSGGGSTGQAPGAGSAFSATFEKNKLSGLYVRQQMIPLAIGGRMTFNLRREFFYFFPDGHVLFGVPTAPGTLKEHPTAADFASFKDVAPDMRGTYTIADDKITIKPDKGGARTEPFSYPKTGDDSVLQIGPPSVVGSVKAVPFKAGQRIDGTYEFDGSVGLAGPNSIFNVKTLTFRPDGTISSDQLTGADTAGIQTSVGSSGVTTHSQTSASGTYKLDSYTLETTIGGKTDKQTAFRRAGDDKPETPGLLCIAGRVYWRKETKK